MPVEIRTIVPTEEPRYHELMAQSFSQGRAPRARDEHEPREPNHENFGLFDNGALCAAYTLISFNVHWGGQAVQPMGGIAGVGSFAHARGRGHVGALLRHALQTMRERGQVVSALYPFAHAFYRRFGWEWVGQKQRMTLPLRALATWPEGRHVHELRADQARPVLEPVYARYAQNYRGACDAATHRWDGVLRPDDNRAVYVYVHQTPGAAPDGYLTWRYNNDGKAGFVREFVANSSAAYRGLLSLLHYFGTQCDQADLNRLPSDNPLWSFVMHNDLETKLQPVFMGRVVDVAKALQSVDVRPGGPDGAATLKVHDETAPWNSGTWRVAKQGEQLTCVPATGAADMVCDIQAFSQMFWGVPLLEALRRAGRVDVHNLRSIGFLSFLFGGAPVFTLDGF